MVLSNKKFKQKLRAELAHSQSANPDCCLKNLLDSTTQKIRFSKREKRRKIRSLRQSEAAQEGGDGHTVDKSKEDEGTQRKSKKRKRKAEDNGVAIGAVKDAKNSKKRRDKKKKKNTKKAKKHKDKDPNPGDEPPEASELTKSNGSGQIADVPTKVYVGGIPYYSTDDDIRSYFQGCGTITEIDCMTFPETGKFRGIALISFKTEAAAKRALALDGSDMGGLFLKIQPYKATRTVKGSDFTPKPVEGYNRIYVGNLSWDITEDQLRTLFSNCSISSIRFGMDKETGEFRGYAHVDLTDSQSVKTALSLDQKVMCGRPVRITCAVPLKKPWKQTSDVPPNTQVDREKSSSSGSGKMKRRTCFECGEKGHISSACPKKQNVDSSTS
ncbi:protein gar2-like [Neltuma alba]|uniref:protein gar2-like n=1 Tax=Neltuma alba TaxID=207710 RepID=UPI0010A4F38B|nr:protein gar2-like [Prosopis alba]XP_028798631.1 protein gar2-like [Prosopis alba]